jgi:hypothetical protein
MRLDAFVSENQAFAFILHPRGSLAITTIITTISITNTN